MKKLIILLWIALLATTTFAQWPGMGKVEYKTMPSKILDVEREYSIYLPQNYENNTNKEYPVLYLLHGGGGSHKDWPGRGHVADVANQLIASGEAEEMIIVCPEAGKNFMNYFNCPEWQYEDYFFEELIPFIENNYRAKTGKENRAVAGLSMGGGGTIVYATHHPEMFCAAYAMSSYVYRHDNLFWIDFNDPVQKKVHQLVEDHNCVKLIQTADQTTIDKIKTVKWFVDCGDDDFTLKANLEFVTAMNDAKVPLQFRVRDGGHTWEYWHSALYIALPFISNVFRN